MKDDAKKFFKHRSGQKGFTLVELIVVIVIIGILSAMAVPSMGTFMAQRRINGAARQVMTDLMSARMKAISENRDFQVSFPTSTGASYTVDAAGTSPSVKNIQTLYGYFDVGISANNNPTFKSNGLLSGATNCTVTLINTAGRVSSRTISVSSGGRVVIN